MSNLTIFCPIHGSIELSPLTIKILNTPEMQRLRDLKQLGATYLVFPSGTHSRLEHSLGVCYLAMKMGRKLKRVHPELNISNRLIELFGIAGLIHDIGHGPFSHLYDHYIRNESEPEHEERGLLIFKNLCEREKLELSQEEIDEICKMVNPEGDDIYNWKYQIVANKSCDIDVDKIDYIQRDSYHLGISHTGELNRLVKLIRINKTDKGDEITWDKKLEFDIYSLFSNRYRLHKQVYKHHTICSFEYIIIKIMKKLKEKIGIKLANATDSIIIQYCYKNIQDELSKGILYRLHPHMYKQLVLKKNNKEYEKGFIGYADNIIIEFIKIGFVSGDRQNPLELVNYYNGKEEYPNKTFKLAPGETSFIITNQFQEVIMRMYTLDDDKIDEEDLEKKWNELKDGENEINY